jgi:hypothetical protein
MASFCGQCSKATFDITNQNDFDHLGDPGEEKAWVVLCEGCGPIQVDKDGNCVSEDCLENHNRKEDTNDS